MKKKLVYKGMSREARDAWAKKRMAESEPKTPRATKDDDDETVRFRQEARASEMAKMEKQYIEKAKGLDARIQVNGVTYEKDKPVVADYGALTPYQEKKLEKFESLGILHAL